MNCIKTIVNSTYELKECWLFENRRYFFEGKYFLLPVIGLKYKELLDTLGISYKVVINSYNEQCLMYWDSEYVEYVEKSAPLYYKYSYGVYKYTGKSYSAKLPSEKMIQMANLLGLTIERAIDSFEKFQTAKKLLDGRTACFYTRYDYEDLSTKWLNEDIRQFSFIFNSVFGPCYGVALFDINLIKSNNYNVVTLNLSDDDKKYTGIIIGKGGCRVKDWCKELGIKKIIVK